MRTAARVLLALAALFFLGTGLGIMFNPAAMAEGLSMSPDGILGLSNMRGLFGGAVAAIGISVAIAAYKGEIIHARPGVLFVIAIVIGRLVGLAADGYDATAVQFIAVPVVVFALLLAAHKMLDKANATHA